ncbi:MAG: hypothetical protein ACRELE_09270 [Gemmatimonadales bacterium]
MARGLLRSGDERREHALDLFYFGQMAKGGLFSDQPQVSSQE